MRAERTSETTPPPKPTKEEESVNRVCPGELQTASMSFGDLRQESKGYYNEREGEKQNEEASTSERDEI